MTRVTVSLNPDERDALLELAQREKRTPSDQVAKILSDELARRGLLPTDAQKAEVAQGGDGDRAN
jgi:predicted transcriptional regulator